jgi:hypothetical protein
MVVMGDKLGGGPADQLASVLRIVSRVLFLKSSRFHPTLLGQRERLPRTRNARRKRTSDIRGVARKAYLSCISGFPLQGVHRFESP